MTIAFAQKHQVCFYRNDETGQTFARNERAKVKKAMVSEFNEKVTKGENPEDIYINYFMYYGNHVNQQLWIEDSATLTYTAYGDGIPEFI